MYKIAHITDLHVSYLDEDEHGKRLVEILKDISARNCDHIIVTGDIVDNPNPEDFSFVREIFSHFGLLDRDKLSVVTGNHDIFGGTPRGQDSFRFYLNCKEVDFEKNMDRFIETFKETFPSNNSFPYSKIIGNVAIIGINSIGKWSMKENREGSNGIVTAEDFIKLKNILSSEELNGKYKLVLIHHHFNKPDMDSELHPAHSLWLEAINWKMKLYKKKELLKLFRSKKVNLILNGHTHINQIYNIGGIGVVNSSSCVMPLADDQNRYYNIISIPGEVEEGSAIKVETVGIG